MRDGAGHAHGFSIDIVGSGVRAVAANAVPGVHGSVESHLGCGRSWTSELMKQ